MEKQQKHRAGPHCPRGPAHPHATPGVGMAPARDAQRRTLHGGLPAAVEQGLTVLLPKEAWGDTRPITLSSAILKALAQLLCMHQHTPMGSATQAGDGTHPHTPEATSG